jgi:peptidyl-prolyl cis-trans isomerase SurA
MSKGELDPEYAKAAYSLKEDGISTIVETPFGYHIIQLIARKDERINTRHILIKPRANQKEIAQALNRLDSIAKAIRMDSIKFESAAYFYSDDKNSRLNKGLVINQHNSSSKFELDELNPSDYYAIKKLQVNEISNPFESVDENNKQVFKIIKLLSRTDPHRANLKNDYQLIEERALNFKRKKNLEDWVTEKQQSTYIHIDDSFKKCDFKYSGWIKQ